jgi:hypothetical protein
LIFPFYYVILTFFIQVGLTGEPMEIRIVIVAAELETNEKED